MKNLYYLVIVLLFIQCRSTNNSTSVNTTTKETFKPISSKAWAYKDFQKDSILGISLDKAYNQIIKGRKGKKVIVAIIDTEIDVNHEELKGSIWINSDEIPNNNIDDDKNGYVDDINGWNFLGKRGYDEFISNYNYTRILKKYSSKFKDKDSSQIKDIKHYKLYLRAKKAYDEEKAKVDREFAYAAAAKIKIDKSNRTIDSIFGTTKVSIEKIDSCLTHFTNIKKDKIAFDFKVASATRKQCNCDNYIEDFLQDTKLISNYAINLDFDENKVLQDEIYNLDFNTGNGDVGKGVSVTHHGTQVASLIASNRNNETGIMGVNNYVSIMPIVVMPIIGEETDKNLALAIRYAVDNGAKIINLSATRKFYTNKEWVEDALLYAERNNVLIVKAGGNYGQNADNVESIPNDNFKGQELNNFINVGMSDSDIKGSLIPNWANYGKKNIDLFAPGYKVFVASPLNKYIENSGSSLSTAFVSGVASLLLSYYPDLTAKQLKNIILNSAERYDVVFKLNDKDVNFKDLSKTGGILNAYNALVLAEQVSNDK